jgi:hypothetical protein
VRGLSLDFQSRGVLRKIQRFFIFITGLCEAEGTVWTGAVRQGCCHSHGDLSRDKQDTRMAKRQETELFIERKVLLCDLTFLFISYSFQHSLVFTSFYR